MRRTLLVGLALFVGCRPEIEDDASRVEGPRILAVRAEPAEARPNEKVTLTALYTDGAAAVAGAPLGWSFCVARKPLAEPGSVDPGCLAGESAVVLGGGSSVVASLAADACRAFGPDRPIAKAGEPAGRPADPDATGGFFQPGLVRGGGASTTLFEVRLRCALPSAPQTISRAFEQRYVANTNPEIATVERVRAGAVETVGAELRVGAREEVRVRVSWPACAAAPCGGAEPYVSYDSAGRGLVDRREALVVSWLTSAGTWLSPRTGRSENDPVTSTESTFVAPASGTGTLFFVLRDARGGVAYRTVPFVVQ